MAPASLAAPADVHNPTGLPVYPNVDYERLDSRLRTDGLGRWCMRLSARSFDSLAVIENWYRHALSAASETDLRNDGDYERVYVELDGIKLTVNLAFVAVYKASKGAATSIDIVRLAANAADTRAERQALPETFKRSQPSARSR
jgi:hypothetical protein